MLKESTESKITRILRQRFKSDDGDIHKEKSHMLAEFLLEGGYVQASIAAYRRILNADPNDINAKAIIQNLRNLLQ